MSDLYKELSRVGNATRVRALLEMAALESGVRADPSNRALVALALCRAGTRAEDVAAQLSWSEFESFCSKLLRSSGYSVMENLHLKRPRAQIDLLAFGQSISLCVDCKHWEREHSQSALKRMAEKQLARSSLVRKSHPQAPPIASVILSFSAYQGAFVDGVAVVPIRALRSFLNSIDSYRDKLEFV